MEPCQVHQMHLKIFHTILQMEFDANTLKEYIELEMRIAECEKNRWQKVLDLNADTIGKISPMKMVFTSPPEQQTNFLTKPQLLIEPRYVFTSILDVLGF